jgi:hypothetical protein
MIFVSSQVKNNKQQILLPWQTTARTPHFLKYDIRRHQAKQSHILLLLHPSCFSSASHYNGHGYQCNSPIDKLLVFARTKSLQALHIAYSLKDLNYRIIMLELL